MSALFKAWCCGLLVGLSACGGRGAIFLTIEARGPSGMLSTPGDIDRLHVVVQGEADAVLLDKDYPLTSSQSFPLTLALEQGPQTGALVQISVEAFLAETAVGLVRASVPITREEVNNVTVRITRE